MLLGRKRGASAPGAEFGVLSGAAAELGGAEADLSTPRHHVAMHSAAGSSCKYPLQCMWQNLGAEAAARPFRIWPTYSLEKGDARTQSTCRPQPEAETHRVLSGADHACAFTIHLQKQAPGLTRPRVSLRATRAEASAADICFCCRCAAETLNVRSASCL